MGSEAAGAGGLSARTPAAGTPCGAVCVLTGRARLGPWWWAGDDGSEEDVRQRGVDGGEEDDSKDDGARVGAPGALAAGVDGGGEDNGARTAQLGFVRRSRAGGEGEKEFKVFIVQVAFSPGPGHGPGLKVL